MTTTSPRGQLTMLISLCFSVRMEAFKEKTDSSEDIRIPDVPETNTQGVQVDLVNLLDLQALQNMEDDEDECKEDEDDNESLRSE